MRDVKIKKYLKKMDYSYALGIHPTIELIRNKPTKIVKILLREDSHSKYKEIDLIKYLCNKNGIRLDYNNRWIEKISKKENTYAAGIFEKYEEAIDKMKNHVVLLNPSDMGNLGTIIRSMVAFNYFDLVMITPAADIFDPKVISTTTGSLFKIRFSQFDNLENYLDKYEFHNLYLFSAEGDIPLQKLRTKDPYSLVFGHETRGIDPKYHQYGDTVTIEQSQEVESLNLAISASIAMHATKN